MKKDRHGWGNSLSMGLSGSAICFAHDHTATGELIWAIALNWQILRGSSLRCFTPWVTYCNMHEATTDTDSTALNLPQNQTIK